MNNSLGKKNGGAESLPLRTYYQDPNVEADLDVYLSDSDCEAIDINVAELIAGKP